MGTFVVGHSALSHRSGSDPQDGQRPRPGKVPAGELPKLSDFAMERNKKSGCRCILIFISRLIFTQSFTWLSWMVR